MGINYFVFSNLKFQINLINIFFAKKTIKI